VDVTGSCTTGFGTFTGGQEKPGASQSQTQAVTNATDLSGFSGAISSYGNLGLVMNIAQPAGGSIDLTSLVLTVYASGQAPKSVQLTCPTGGCVYGSSTPGLGTSDELFGISSDEVSSLGTFSSTAHIGQAAAFSGAHGAPESFFLAAIPPAPTTGGGSGNPGGGLVPEPGGALLVLAGLAGISLARRRRSQE
jgi:hypothetical protein